MIKGEECLGEDSKSDEFARELNGLHGGLTCYPQVYPYRQRAVPGSLGACWARMGKRRKGVRRCLRPSRLHKPERHAIGFADGLHLRVLGCGTGQIRWQAMHVDVFGVLG